MKEAMFISSSTNNIFAIIQIVYAQRYFFPGI